MFYSAPSKTDIKSIIVSRTDKIGDLILSIPSFATLRAMYPDAKIRVLVRNYNYDIVKSLPCIDEAVAIDSYTSDKLAQLIGSYKADAFIALYSDSQVLQLCRLSMAPIKIGPLSKLGSFFVYKNGIRQKRSESLKNEAEYNLDLVRRLNPEAFDRCGIHSQKINIDSTSRTHVNEFLHERSIKYFILVHPFSGGSAKNFTYEQYADVLRRVAALNKDLSIVISAVKDDSQIALDMARTICDNCYVYVSTGSILNLAALIDRASVYVGGSTGPSHIAGNLGKSCVLIYPNKPTQSPTRWGLYLNDKAHYIIPDLNSTDEDYSHNIFAHIDSALLDEAARVIVESINE